MRILMFALFLIPPIAFGEVADSIVGRWQYDSVRTLNAFIDELLVAEPDALTPEQVEELKSGAVKNADMVDKIDSTIKATITEDAISVINDHGQRTTSNYEVVGGNASLVVVSGKSSEGNEFLTNIRLVEGGIAMQTVDCESHPEMCEFPQDPEQREPDAGRLTIVSPAPGPPTTPGRPSQPRWIFFRPIADEHN